MEDDGRPLGAVVHLAGESISGKRWTEARKKSIHDSRVMGTRTLVDWLIRRPQRPELLVAASAIGFYGDRGDELLTEDATQGKGFLADLCAAWEAEARRAEQAGIRVVILRLGVVLSAEGGALAQMRLPFKLGAGGPVGSGRQWFAWVHVDDVVAAIQWALHRPEARGVYNLAAPGIVREAEFAHALGKAMHRPSFVPTPAFALRLAFGELADEALLSSARTVPMRLLAEGFAFRFPELGAALASTEG